MEYILWSYLVIFSRLCMLSPGWCVGCVPPFYSPSLYSNVTGCTQRQTPCHSSEHSFVKSKRPLCLEAGFLSEVTAISANLSYSRPNSCRISPATVPFWRYMQLMQHVILNTVAKWPKTPCISGDLNHMTFTSLSKDSLIHIWIPQIGNDSSLCSICLHCREQRNSKSRQ